MIRPALLLVMSFLHAACSAQTPTATENATAATAPDGGTTSTMAATQIAISSESGRVTAELVDNEATRKLLRMLPLTIEMRDHLRQEKTGNLPSPLPEVQRQTAFSAGTLGLWGNDDFVIYYRDGDVPSPGIVVLGRVVDGVSVFDRPGPVTITIQRM
jgi:hypothetical protein